MVYLVGAGPGDPGLMTVRAMALLKTADVVLYDRLAAPSLLMETKPGCILIDVGKSAGKHTKSQNETTNLLVEYGAKGLEVVRLKGGDPYLFGRGGEEAERLVTKGIPFAVVPGVSALTAATAYAGIPITHRDFASSVGVATGHGADDKESDPVRWRELARAVDTIVVFMGIGSVDAIVTELKAGGLSGVTPTAVVEQGSTPLQRMVTGTLDTISTDIAREKVTPPALLIVGKTVSLHETLSWYKPGPLAGLRIGITRPLDQSKTFAERLSALGASPVPMPTIATEDTIETDEVKNAIENAHWYDCIVFSSVNGVESFFRALKKYGRDARAVASAKIACIGPVTGDACERFAIRPDIVAERYIAEGLASAILSGESAAGKRFLLVRSDIGRDTLAKSLEAAGGTVDQTVFYITRAEELTEHVRGLIMKKGIDIVSFTSSSTVDNFFSQIDADKIAEGIKIASIGPQTSETLRKYGREPNVEATVYTTAGLTDAIVTAYGKRD